MNIYGKTKENINSDNGFSIIELTVVLLIVSIVSVLALMSFKNESKYLADSQAYQVIDLIQEARQRSLTQRETMRVEINQTRNIVRLISENEPGNADDDKELRSIKLQEPNNVVVGVRPQNVVNPPTDLSPIPTLTFKTSVHPLSKSDTVATLRFVRTGKVLDAGSNSIGDNAVVTGATIYVWMPDSGSSNRILETGSIIRAITVQGVSGMSSYLKCPLTDGKCENWIK